MSHSTFVRHFLICGLDTAAGLELDDAGMSSNYFDAFLVCRFSSPECINKVNKNAVISLYIGAKWIHHDQAIGFHL